MRETLFRTFAAAIFLTAAFLSVRATAVAVEADNPRSAKFAVTDAPSSNPARKQMVIQNPDGTMTVQKEPPSGAAKDAKVKKGLVIPAQVVVPMSSSIGAAVAR